MNAVCPGMITTPMTLGLADKWPKHIPPPPPPELIVPSKRMGRPEEIADAVVGVTRHSSQVECISQACGAFGLSKPRAWGSQGRLLSVADAVVGVSRAVS